jgi:hypothetical protein
MCQDDDVRTEMSCDSNITFGVDCLIDCVRNLLIQLVVDPFRFVILQRIAFQLCQCQICARNFRVCASSSSFSNFVLGKP